MIYLEQQLHTHCVKLFGGNVRLALSDTLPDLWLGDIELAHLNSSPKLNQNLIIDSNVAHMRVLRQTTTDDYEYGMESVLESEQYMNFTGDCLLKKGHSIEQVDIYETYYDGIGGNDVSLRKESFENAPSPHHNDTSDVLLISNGSWDATALPLTAITNWQAVYNERYLIQYVCYEDVRKGQVWKKEYYENNMLLYSEQLPREFDQIGRAHV